MCFFWQKRRKLKQCSLYFRMLQTIQKLLLACPLSYLALWVREHLGLFYIENLYRKLFLYRKKNSFFIACNFHFLIYFYGRNKRCLGFFNYSTIFIFKKKSREFTKSKTLKYPPALIIWSILIKFYFFLPFSCALYNG